MAKKPYLLLTLFVALATVCHAQYVLHDARQFSVDGRGYGTGFQRLSYSENNFAMWGDNDPSGTDLIESVTYSLDTWSATGIGSGNLRVDSWNLSSACVSDSVLWLGMENSLRYTTDFENWVSIDISDPGRVNTISGMYPMEGGAVVVTLYTFIVEEEIISGGTVIRTVSDRRARVIIASKDGVRRLYDSPGNSFGYSMAIPSENESIFVAAKDFSDTTSMFLVIDSGGTAEYVYPPYPLTYWFSPNAISRNSIGDFYISYYYVGERRDVKPFVIRYNAASKTTTLIEIPYETQASISFSFNDGEYVYFPTTYGFYVFHGDKFEHFRILDLVPELIYDHFLYGLASLSKDTLVISVGNQFVHLPKSVLYSKVTSVQEDFRSGRVAHGDRIDIPMNVSDGALVNWTAYNEIGQVLDNGSSTCNAGFVVVPVGGFGRTQIVNLVLSASGKPPITQRVFVE